jgi:hydrogenase expression/formation protein HypC
MWMVFKEKPVCCCLRTRLLLLEDARVGDYVIVHAGFAIQILDESAAQETLDLLREAIAAVEKSEPNQN